jgi:hypothetical protein
MEDMLSRCVSFRDLVGAGNAEEAKSRIKFISCQDYDKSSKLYTAIPMPRVAIWNLNPSKRRQSAAVYSCQPRLLLSLEIEIPDEVENSEDAQFRYCGPLYEAVEDELARMSATPGELHFIEINYLQVPTPADPKENQGRKFWGADIEFVCQG